MAGYLPPEVRERVRQQAGERCGYCQSSERWLGIAHEVEHIVPVSVGGANQEDNLWLACRRCNSFKADRVKAIDTATNRSAPLFNPRFDQWNQHFAWSICGTQIVGRSEVGRATVEALRLNHSLIVAAREMWVRCGVHPPGNRLNS